MSDRPKFPFAAGLGPLRLDPTRPDMAVLADAKGVMVAGHAAI